MMEKWTWLSLCLLYLVAHTSNVLAEEKIPSFDDPDYPIEESTTTTEEEEEEEQCVGAACDPWEEPVREKSEPQQREVEKKEEEEAEAEEAERCAGGDCDPWMGPPRKPEHPEEDDDGGYGEEEDDGDAVCTTCDDDTQTCSKLPFNLSVDTLCASNICLDGVDLNLETLIHLFKKIVAKKGRCPFGPPLINCTDAVECPPRETVSMCHKERVKSKPKNHPEYPSISSRDVGDQEEEERGGGGNNHGPEKKDKPQPFTGRIMTICVPKTRPDLIKKLLKMGDTIGPCNCTELFPPGPRGPPGRPGKPGRPGPKGDDGDKGRPGMKGDQGDKGRPGMKGDQGDKGRPGMKGDQGRPGMKGDQGRHGMKGDDGEVGPPGPEGPRGRIGPRGMKGNQGDKGDKGDKGDSGIGGPPLLNCTDCSCAEGKFPVCHIERSQEGIATGSILTLCLDTRQQVIRHEQFHGDTRGHCNCTDRRDKCRVICFRGKTLCVPPEHIVKRDWTLDVQDGPCPGKPCTVICTTNSRTICVPPNKLPWWIGENEAELGPCPPDECPEACGDNDGKPHGERKPCTVFCTPENKEICVNRDRMMEWHTRDGSRSVRGSCPCVTICKPNHYYSNDQNQTMCVPPHTLEDEFRNGATRGACPCVVICKPVQAYHQPYGIMVNKTLCVDSQTLEQHLRQGAQKGCCEPETCPVACTNVTGPAGPKGDQGNRGPRGPRGPRGMKGEKGDQGEQGNNGTQGDQGIPGPPGSDGQPGPPGEQGEQGNNGTQGEMGIQGEQGNNGTQGEMGIQGPEGECSCNSTEIITEVLDKVNCSCEGERGPPGPPLQDCHDCDCAQGTIAVCHAIRNSRGIPTGAITTLCLSSRQEVIPHLDHGDHLGHCNCSVLECTQCDDKRDFKPCRVICFRDKTICVNPEKIYERHFLLGATDGPCPSDECPAACDDQCPDACGDEHHDYHDGDGKPRPPCIVICTKDKRSICVDPKKLRWFLSEKNATKGACPPSECPGPCDETCPAACNETVGQPGPRGPRGPRGRPGADGTDGADGEDGATGETGPEGECSCNNTEIIKEIIESGNLTGPEGPEGPQGPPGNSSFEKCVVICAFVDPHARHWKAIRKTICVLPGTLHHHIHLGATKGPCEPSTCPAACNSTMGQPGKDGEDGTDGTDGQDGEDGEDGEDGLHCWDLNGNGDCDPFEDFTDDDDCTVLDCRGPPGLPGNGTNGGGGDPFDKCVVICKSSQHYGQKWKNTTICVLPETLPEHFAAGATKGPCACITICKPIQSPHYKRNGIVENKTICVPPNTLGQHFQEGAQKGPCPPEECPVPCDDVCPAACGNITGPPGEDGQDGLDGTDGTDGQDGLDGTDGKDGTNGTNGTDGQDGMDGQDGADGNCTQECPPGPPGPEGPSGNCTDCPPGLPGPPGEDGEDGMDGQDGADGNCTDCPPGLPGPPGEDGTDGTDGQDGMDGQDGADGNCTDCPPGLPGPPGEDGMDGQDGADGNCTAECPPGLDGKDGEDGMDGQDGNCTAECPAGPPGPPGPPGDGSNGTCSCNSTEIIKEIIESGNCSCPAGEDGMDGQDGRDGVDGTDGQDGMDGECQCNNTLIIEEVLEEVNCTCEGEPGPPGPPGDCSNCPPGLPGPPGPAGNCTDCPPGEDGVDGTDGIDGQDGVDGRNGTNGINGQDGVDGTDGTNGQDGVDGMDGECQCNNTLIIEEVLEEVNCTCEGEPGPPGPPGDCSNCPPGLPGPPGPAGNCTDCPPGEDGKDGVDGTDGIDGQDGVDGQNGTNGIDGKDGINGNDGTDGQNGTNGNDGIDGQDGMDGNCTCNSTEIIKEIIETGNCSCPAGEDGQDGTDGVDGTDGIDGEDGKDGEPGPPGPNGPLNNLTDVIINNATTCDVLHFENNTWTNRNLTELIINILNNITIPCDCPIICGCKGKVSMLVLRYTGDVIANITVRQKKPDVVVFGPTPIVPGGAFAINGVDDKGTLSTEITLFINGTLDATIHTSCSDPIGPGLVAGSFVVVSGESNDCQGPLCPVGNETNGGSDPEQGQVEICHIESSQDPVTIFVNESDLPTHLGHGDTLGPCPSTSSAEEDDDKRSAAASQSAWSW